MGRNGKTLVRWVGERNQPLRPQSLSPELRGDWDEGLGTMAAVKALDSQIRHKHFLHGEFGEGDLDPVCLVFTRDEVPPSLVAGTSALTPESPRPPADPGKVPAGHGHTASHTHTPLR